MLSLLYCSKIVCLLIGNLCCVACIVIINEEGLSPLLIMSFFGNLIRIAMSCDPLEVYHATLMVSYPYCSINVCLICQIVISKPLAVD